MKAGHLTLFRALLALAGVAAAASFFFLPLAWWTPLWALSASLHDSPHLLDALLSLPPLLCLIPAAVMLPVCVKSCRGRERVLLLALAVPGLAAGLLGFGGNVAMLPLSLGWRPLPYGVLALACYVCAIPLTCLLLPRYEHLRPNGGPLLILGETAKVLLCLLLFSFCFAYPATGSKDRVVETTQGLAVARWLTADGGGSGIYTAPCYELVGPLLYGARLDLAWDAPDHGQGR